MVFVLLPWLRDKKRKKKRPKPKTKREKARRKKQSEFEFGLGVPQGTFDFTKPAQEKAIDRRKNSKNPNKPLDIHDLVGGSGAVAKAEAKKFEGSPTGQFLGQAGKDIGKLGTKIFDGGK